MRIHPPYQQWKTRFSSLTAKPNISRLEKWGEFVQWQKYTLHTLFFVTVFVAFVIAFIAIYYEAIRTEFILESIEVPEELEKSGYTGTYIAEKLVEELHNIDLSIKAVTSSSLPIGLSYKLTAKDQIPDIEIPSTNFTFHSLARFLRSKLGYEIPYIRGNIIKSNGKYLLSLRHMTNKAIPSAITQPQENIDQLIEEVGTEALLEIVNPLTLALRYYGKIDEYNADSDQANNAFRAMESKIDHCLKYEPTTDDDFAFTLRGAGLHKMKKHEDASTAFNKAIKINPKNSEAYNGLGYLLIEVGKFDEAITQFKIAIELDDTNPVYYNNLGAALSALNRNQEAIEKLNHAIKLDSGNFMAYTNLGKTLNDLKHYNEAIEKFEIAIRINQNSAELYNNWGLALYYLNRPTDAIEKFRVATEIDPNHYMAYNNWGLAMMKLSPPEFTNAIENINKAIVLNRDYPAPYFNWGLALIGLGKPIETIEKINKAIELTKNPRYQHEQLDKDKLYAIFGVLFAQLNRYEEAITYFEEAQKISPNFDWDTTGGFTFEMAWSIQMSLPQYKNPYRTLLYLKYRYIDILPKDFVGYDLLYPAYIENPRDSFYPLVENLKNPEDKRVWKNLKELARIIVKNPNINLNSYSIAYNNWIVTDILLSKLEVAIQLYQKTVESNPRYDAAYINWGQVLQLLGYPDATVIAKFNKAININPNNAHAYFAWGNNLKITGHQQLSAMFYRKANEINPKLVVHTQH